MNLFLIGIVILIIFVIFMYCFLNKKEHFKSTVTPRKPIPLCSNHGSIDENKTLPDKGIVCACEPGWTGNVCDTASPPPIPECNNRGTIIVGENPRKCSCNPGWEGNLCEIPNCNSNGTYNNYKKQCICKDGYSGSECQYSRKDTCSGNGDVIDDSGTCKCDSQKYYYFPSEDDCKNNKDCDQYFTEVPLFQGDDCYNPIDISVDPINNVPANPPIKSYKNLYNLDSAGNPIFPYADQKGLKPGVKQSSLLGQDSGIDDDADYVKICPFSNTLTINDDIDCTILEKDDPIYGDIKIGKVIVGQKDSNGCRTILNGYKINPADPSFPKVVGKIVRPFDVGRIGTKCKFTTTDKNGNNQNITIQRLPYPLSNNSLDSEKHIDPNPLDNPYEKNYDSYELSSSPYLQGSDNYYKENGVYYDSPAAVYAYNQLNPANPYPEQKSAYVVIGNKIKNDDACNNNGHYDLLSQTCNCKYGWKGKNCEQIDVNCVNGTIDEDSSSPNYGICICNDGWSGMACDNKILPKTTSCTPGGDCPQSQQKCSLGNNDYICYNGKWTDSVKNCSNKTCSIEGQICADPTPGSYGNNYICRNGLWSNIAFDCIPGASCPQNEQLCLKTPGPGVKQYSCDNNVWSETADSCSGWQCNASIIGPSQEGQVCLKGSIGASDGDYICKKTNSYFDYPYKWVKKDDNSFKKCPPKCEINGRCDVDTGRCICNDGYSGADCSLKSCPNNCSGKTNGNCDGSTGKCTCINGYSGDDCSIPSVCVPKCDPNCGQQNGCGGYCVGGPSLDNIIPGTIWIDSNKINLTLTSQDGYPIFSNSDNSFKIYLEKAGSGTFRITSLIVKGVNVPTTLGNLTQDFESGKIIYYSDNKIYWVRPQQCV